MRWKGTDSAGWHRRKEARREKLHVGKLIAGSCLQSVSQNQWIGCVWLQILLGRKGRSREVLEKGAMTLTPGMIILIVV